MWHDFTRISAQRRLDFIERNPRLEVGEQVELQVIADFADQENVIVPGNYLNWSSHTEGVASVSERGVITGVSNGTTVFSVERDGLQAVTVSRVGQADSPSTEAELNMALAEYYGLDVYPDAVTLTRDVERQILVGIEGVPDSPDLSDDATGTRYFVNNPSVISISEDGLITTLDEGEAEVTVIHGGIEAVIPVNVETPNLGATELSAEGGIVENSDGYQVMIPEGALAEDTEIEITTLNPTELTAPLPEEFEVIDAFNLSFGEEDLAIPGQLAIPAPESLAPGTEVFFMRDGESPDETGTWNQTWFVEESGIVGDDGMIRTSSPPWPGVAKGDDYIISVPKFEYKVGNAYLTPEYVDFVSQAGVILKNTGVSFARRIPGGGVTTAVVGGIGLAYLTIPFLYKTTEAVSTLEVVSVPKIGTLPFTTTAGVEINPRGIPTANIVLDDPIPVTENDPFAPPVLSQGRLDFGELEEPVVYLTGSNFLVDSDSPDVSGTSFNDLTVTFDYAGVEYEGEIIPELSQDLGDNQYRIGIRAPQTVILAESRIGLTRTQLELTDIDDPTSTESVPYSSQRTVTIRPQDLEFTLSAQAFNDQVSVFNALNPEEILETDGLTSRDLLLAQISVGTGGTFDDEPRDLVATKDGTHAYVSLRSSGQLAVIDLLSLQQVDTKPETENVIDPIQLPVGAAPHAIATSYDDRYAYVGDYRAGTLYIVDLDSRSDTYHQVVEIISLADAAEGIRSLAVSSDSKKLFASVPGTNFQADEGKVYVFNIDPEDKPKELENQPGLFEPNTQKWHDVIDVLEVEKGVEGISATSDPNVMVFTNRVEDFKGFGRIKVTNEDPTDFAADVSYTSLGLGSAQDYFDVNDARDIVITSDGKYGFIAGANARNFGSGIPSIDGPKAGSNVGIIVDPLTENAKLVAATRPIPNGFTSSVSISSDDKYLFASYPGVGGVYAWDIEEMIETLENPGEFVIDHLGRGVGSPIFLPSTQKIATKADFDSVPIDNINPDIAIASDLQLIEESYIRNEFEFGVPEDSTRAPLTIGANPWSVTNASHRDWLSLLPVDGDRVTEDSTPIFEWEFESGFEDVEEVNLFVSSFSEGNGLLPWDRLEDLSDPNFLPGLNESAKKELVTRPWQEYDDFNPGRIVTATWKKETNTWYWHDGETEVAQSNEGFQNTKNRFTLPDSLSLTAGQDYSWAVEAISKNGEQNIDFGRFETVAPPSTKPFSSVSVLTHGFTLIQENNTGIPDSFYDFADAITEAQGEDEKGLILRYDKSNTSWIPVDENRRTLTDVTGGLETSDPNYLSTLASNIQDEYANKPLVLLPEWSLDDESKISTSGFTEGAADAIFASMVELDQALGGEIGISDDAGELTQLYDEEGDLIRTHGDLFNSPLHFIGFSRGTVVNSEMIQRLGTYYPYAGGAINADGTPVLDENNKPVRDLQMTTVDPHDFRQENLRVPIPIIGADFRDFNEPEVTVWDNVTFADNYYQTVANENGISGTPNGREIEDADVNVHLDGRTGFTWDNRIGGPHTRVFGWYAGTADFDIEEVQAGYQVDSTGLISEPIYDRLGEGSLSQLLEPEDPDRFSALTSWYDSDSELNSEGIGEGWAYSVLGGGKRPDANLSTRTPVSFDNTDTDGVAGDFAVPTVFNGNFDYGIDNTPGEEISDDTKVPGWSFHNGEDEEPLLNKHLVDKSSITTLEDKPDDPDEDFVVKLSNGNGGIREFVHNEKFIPDWGVLRFDVHAPELGEFNDTSNYITAWIEDDNGNFVELKSKDPTTYAPNFDDTGYNKNPLFPAVDLREVKVLDSLTLQGQTNRVDYGQTGFETFFVDIPLEFRNRSRKIKFEVKGSKTVFIDNVFIGSYDLRFGVPKFNQQEARDELNSNFNQNYLSEKPQFSLSYNSDTKLSNWVNWSLNNSWIPDVKTPRTRFAEDVSLPFPGERVIEEDYTSGIVPPPYNRGHLAAASDRKRTAKDSYSTFLTSNVVPQSSRSNAGDSPWNALEEHLQNLAKQGKEIHILSGGIKSPEPPLLETDQPLTGIEIPNHTWKLAVVLKEPGLNANEIQKDNATLIEDAIAIIVPNIELDTTFSEGTTFPIPAYPYTIPIESQEEWQNWENWQVSYRELQKATDLRFLTGLNAKTRDFIHSLSLPNPSSPLLAETEFVNSLPSVFGTNQSTAIGHDGVIIESPKNIRNASSKFFPVDKDSFKISANQNSKFQLNSSDFSSLKNSISQIGSFEVSPTQISFAKNNSFKVGTPEIGISQIGASQTHGTQVSPFENSIAEISTHRPRTVQNSSREIGISQIGFNKTNRRQISPPQISSFEIDSTEVSFANSVSSEQFFSVHNSTPQIINVLNNSATNIWSDLLQTETQLDINFQITDLPTGQLAEATITGFNDSGTPDAGTIEIDHNANGVGWFIDETPLDNSEFTAQDTDSYLLAAAESEANGQYDLLTTVLHELAHLYGFIDGYAGFDANIETENGTTKFVGDDFEAILDGEHLNKQAHPDDLMNTHLAPGIRKLPSELNVQILQAILANEDGETRGQGDKENLNAALSSDPLLAITNGDFSISDTTTDSFAWDTRGASGIEDGQAVLTEDSPFLSNFTQTFTVPESAKTIQFKLIGAELGASELFPPDAFEVALLDANTNESLTSVSDLSNTDSLLNIQNDGTTYFSDKVRIGGATSGEIIGLDRPRTVTVDISDLTSGSEATLYFDLLGFGDADSRVVIDDVRLSDQFLLPPVANDDTATVTQGDTVEIDILANDTDDDGTLDPDSVQITTEPANGTATVKDDGTVSYTPSDRFIGSDSFTYTVQDNDEQQSETASVDMTVENAIPVISEVQTPDTVTEGVEFRIGAIASDAGNDELTYTWTIDGEALTENNPQINYTFPDNGTYTGSVTVTDTHGGSDTQTFDITVENAVPVVDAGSDVTVDEGSNVEFTGSYSDTGINDTHTVSWDFGDGDTADTSEVSHTYTDDGEYTATYTVTDNDGAVASDTVSVTVNNVAPVIESLTGDTEINEGDTATFNAVATDPGDDTITYIWDFGDGSEQLSASAEQLPVSHIYADNGDYTVTLTVRDEDGGETLSTLDLRVNNVAPTFDAVDGATDVNEGEVVNYSATATDPGDDELTYTWSFDGGTTQIELADVNHVFAQDGSYDATVTVTDDDGASTSQTLSISVNNVAPSIETDDSRTGDEGSAVEFTAAISDPGTDALTITWDFGDGSDPVSTDYSESPTPYEATTSHTYTQNGTYTATVTVTDSDGATTESEVEVTISNVVPLIESLTGDTVINEGDTATFNAIATDAGDDELTYIWDFGDGTEPLITDDSSLVEHTYTDNGEYTVTLTVRDSDGAEAVQTHQITVNNTVPVITSLTGDPRVDEGDLASFSVSASDAGDDTLAYVWDFGDGSDTVMGENAEHIYIDNGLYETSVTVTDDDGASSAQSLTITVDNVAPIADPWLDEESTEGDTVEFNVNFSDPGKLDTHTLTWDFGDGSEPVTTDGTQTSVSHVYADNGTYTASVVITDSDGASTTNTMTVTVNNAAPAIDSLTGDRSVDEGTSANFAIAASDPGADELTYTWDFGDGSTATGTDVLKDTASHIAHTFTQNGTYTVTATVTDDDGASTSSTLEVTVNNVTPTIESLTGDTEVNEGTPAIFNAIATDPGDDTLTYTWDFGDGSEPVAGVDRSSVEHTYTDEGDYNVTLTVTDSDGASISQSLVVAVSNVAPVITQATGDARIDEGGTAQFNATATDAGDDELTYTWNLENGNLAQGQSVEDVYLDNGVYEVTLTVSDGDGGTASSNLTITVDNVAPAIAPIENRSSDEGQAVEFDFSFSDPGILDTHTVVWDFGDGTQPQALDDDATSVSHTYTDNGEYTAILTVTDNDGASTTETVGVTVSNVAPTFTQVNGRTSVDEGEVVNYSATATDPGDDELTYTWSFNNGASEVELADVNHVFAQDGNYNAIVTVTDDDGASTSSTLEVTVNNVAPSIDTDSTQTGDEGSPIEFAATIFDPGTDALAITWDFGDGSEPVTTNYDDSPTPFELTQAHTYAQDGIYNAVVTVTDSDGAVTNSTVEVTINNVAPTIERLSGDTAINEGDTATFSAIASDPGADELTYSWDFGDNTEPMVLVDDASPVEHTYTDNGEYTVTLTVTDPSGAEAIQSLDVTVENVAPTITDASGDTPIDEGGTANFNATAIDPGDDTITYTWSFPDGTELTGEAVSKTFVEDGEYNVNLTARDEDGGSSSRTLTIEVNNVAPIVDALSDRTSDEGSPVAFNASFSDPGVLDTHTIEWNFGDGATATDTLTPTHTYTDNGEYEVALTVTDDEGAATTVNLSVTVNNVAPTITQATGDTPVDEGSVANFSANATDPGADELTYSWNFGDGSEPQTGKSVAHTYADDGEYDVTLTVTDDDGGVTTENLTVTVDNVAPILDRVEFAPPAEGRASQFRAIATDPGDDTLTYTWDFGDGSKAVTGSTVEHLYLDDGDYTITLTVADEDGGVTTSSFAVAVERVFNLKAEGKVRINGRSDLDGEPLNVDDDTRIYAAGGFTINGNQTLPVQRDSNGNVIKQGKKSVLIDRAVTVGPDYSESKANASRNKYVGIVPPQVIDELTVNVTPHDTLIDAELQERVAPDTTPINFNPQNYELNNARNWSRNFPAPGTPERPTVVNIVGGGLNIPNGVDLSNYVIIVERGDLNFNGKGHNLDNVVLVNRNGSINLASVRSNNLSVFAANNINLNSKARFSGDTTIATGNASSNLNFNGATSTLDERSNLEVISQGNITFNSSSTTKGNFTAAKNFTANGRSDIIGSIQAKGDIRINGGINLQNQ